MRQVLNQATSKSFIDLSAFLTIGFGVCTNIHSLPVRICVPFFCVYVLGFAISSKICSKRAFLEWRTSYSKRWQTTSRWFYVSLRKRQRESSISNRTSCKEKHNTTTPIKRV